METAIKDAGISRTTFYGWARQVREGRGTKLQVKFVSAVDRASVERKCLCELMLTKHFEKHWRAIAWWLERKYPNEYGRRRPLPLPELDDFDADPPATRVVWKGYPALPAAKVEPTPAERKPTETSEGISVAWLPGNYYEKLGLEPILGRLLRSDDDRPDALPVAVITDDFWALRFGLDPKILTKRIRIAGIAVAIVGVCPEFTNLPGAQMVDIAMAAALKEPILAGFGVRMISDTHWTLGAALPGDVSPPR